MTSEQNGCACYVVLDRELQLVHQEVSIMLTSAIMCSPSIITATISGHLAP